MKKNIITLWINIYKDGKGRYSIAGAAIYGTKERAEDTGKMVKGYVTTVAVQFEDKELKYE